MRYPGMTMYPNMMGMMHPGMMAMMYPGMMMPSMMGPGMMGVAPNPCASFPSAAGCAGAETKLLDETAEMRKRLRDWRTFGAFSAFVVALFAEMYGFPLTIFLLSGWLGSRFPQLDLLTHDAGHRWHTLLRMKGNPHFDPLHLLSNVLIFGGFVLLSAAWRVLFRAQRERGLATTGPYARLRHPQDAAFALIMLGFLLQWPTLPTLLMFPVLLAMYVRLARREEREAAEQFRDAYFRYAGRTPAFFPRLRGASPAPLLAAVLGIVDVGRAVAGATPASDIHTAPTRPILGTMIRQTKVGGYFLHYHLLSWKERAILMKGMEGIEMRSNLAAARRAGA